MPDCECLARCPFFNDRMAEMPALSRMYKTRYCKGFPDVCARHMVFVELGYEAVPDDLYPNQVERAREVLAVG